MASMLAALEGVGSELSALTARRDRLILEAHGEGLSNRAIAKACGLSHERVRQIVNSRRDAAEVARLTARVAAIDQRWNKFVTKLTAARYGDGHALGRSEVNYRTYENERFERQAAGVDRNGNTSGACGRKSVRRLTVKQEERRLAEASALKFLEDHPDIPVVQVVVRELDEAAILRERLTTLTDSGVPFLHDQKG